jgi:steroid 5-alpha reductase family enzyme
MFQFMFGLEKFEPTLMIRWPGGNVYTQSLTKVHYFFNQLKIRRFFLKIRIPLALVAVGLIIAYGDPDLFLPALSVSLAGALLQSWCFGTLHKKKELAAGGPYALTRNPMYLGRYFLVLGILMLSGVWWLLPLFTVLYYFYMVNRVRREEEVLRGIFEQEYETYCSAVPRFLPTLKPFRGNPVLTFRRDLFLLNHGHWNFLSVIAFYGIAYFAIR